MASDGKRACSKGARYASFNGKRRFRIRDDGSPLGKFEALNCSFIRMPIGSALPGTNEYPWLQIRCSHRPATAREGRHRYSTRR